MAKKHAKAFDITGRPMKGWLLAEGGTTRKELAKWIGIVVNFAKTLPEKK
jgi:hypothetical protein